MPSGPSTSHVFCDETERTRVKSRRRDERRKLAAMRCSRKIEPHATNIGLRTLYPWLDPKMLDRVPRSVDIGIDRSAVDRFFMDWIVEPHADGSCGYTDLLFPKLYYTTQPSSPLADIVHALAYANIRCERTARRSYGAALRGIRTAMCRQDNGCELASDHLLASLIMVHHFEVGHPLSSPCKLLIHF
jgi:hypothetical protein